MRHAIAIFVLLGLAGCATENLSEGAGQTRFTASTGTHRADETPYYREFVYIDGKERASAEVRFRMVNGQPEITVKTLDSKAFEGQAIAGRAIENVTRALADAGVQITPAVVDAILKAAGPP